MGRYAKLAWRVVRHLKTAVPEAPAPAEVSSSALSAATTHSSPGYPANTLVSTNSAPTLYRRYSGHPAIAPMEWMLAARQGVRPHHWQRHTEEGRTYDCTWPLHSGSASSRAKHSVGFAKGPGPAMGPTFEPALAAAHRRTAERIIADYAEPGMLALGLK